QVRGFYYTLLSSYSKQANAGYVIYGGPVDPNDPQSEYHWQVWVGTGAALEQLKVKPTGRPGDPGLRVEDADTYLVVSYDGTNKYRVYIYHSSPGAERDLDFLEYELEPPASGAYLQNPDTDLLIGIDGPFADPNPPLLYPFSGLIQEVAVYDHVV